MTTAYRVRKAWLAAALALAASSGLAFAEATGCDGKNLLDEIKSTNGDAYTRIRSAADKAQNNKTLLWKIESEEFPDHPASYLFGTLSVSDERIKAFTPEVERAFSSSNRIATGVEDMSPARVQEALGAMRETLLSDPKAKLASLLPAADAERTSKLLERTELPPDWQPRVRPWVAIVLTSTSDCERRRLNQGKITHDEELARQAESRGIGTFGLETAEMELAAIAVLPDAEQISLLKAHLALRDRIDDQTETLVRLYLARDIGALWPLRVELARMNGATPGALEAYRQSVLEDSNRRIRDRALMHLNQGGVFVAVDAMRLPGGQGMVELIKDAGYTLTPIE